MPPSSSLRSLAVLAVIATLSSGCNRFPVAAEVRVDPGTRLQTMTGWEATAQAGQEDSVFDRLSERVLAFAVDSLGINRLRLEVGASTEHERALWLEWRQDPLSRDEVPSLPTINDNDNPHDINWRGFHFDQVDYAVERVVLPVKRRLEARGERLLLNVNYIAFDLRPEAVAAFHHRDPEEYAEFALATLLHLREKYGLVPDTWEVILEPEQNSVFSGQYIGRVIVATAARLAEAGFRPAFVAPSTMNTGHAAEYFDAMATVPGALAPLRELSYHRYGGATPENLRAIGERVRRHGITSAMLEHIGSGIDNLFDDIAVAGASAWQQYIITFPGDSGDSTTAGHYVKVWRRVDGALDVSLSPRARLLRQVFLYVRAGAWRIGAESDERRVRALAFADACGGTVVVARALRPATVTIAGLPPGPYAASWTTDAAEGRVDDVPLQNGVAQVEIPAAGAITVFRRGPASPAPAMCQGPPTGPR